MVIDVNHIKQAVSGIENILASSTAPIFAASTVVRQQSEIMIQHAGSKISAIEEHESGGFPARSRRDSVVSKDMHLSLRSEPATLEVSVDSTSASSDDVKTTAGSGKDDGHISTLSTQCMCRKRKTKIINEVNRGGLRIFMETQESASHHQSCRYYLNTERSTRIGVSTRVFSTLLARAVNGSFSATFGGGGFSINPSLNLRYIFRPDSPAFKLLDTIPKKLVDVHSSVICTEDLRAELHRLFQTRQASPFDVDHKGRTLLHVDYPSPIKVAKADKK